MASASVGGVGQICSKACVRQAAATNSLLKILEEPPDGNLLLLTADDNAGILLTICSRCQLIPLQALPIRLAAEVIAGQNPGLSPAESLELTRLSSGCPGLAIGMAQDAMRPLYHDLTAALGEYHDLNLKTNSFFVLTKGLISFQK